MQGREAEAAGGEGLGFIQAIEAAQRENSAKFTNKFGPNVQVTIKEGMMHVALAKKPGEKA